MVQSDGSYFCERGSSLSKKVIMSLRTESFMQTFLSLSNSDVSIFRIIMRDSNGKSKFHHQL